MKKYVKCYYSPTTYDYSDSEYKKLEKAARLFNDIAEEVDTDYTNFEVGETYFDYGQNWMWTTILCKSKNSGYGVQILSPRDQEDILNSTSTRELVNIIERILTRKY